MFIGVSWTIYNTVTELKSPTNLSSQEYVACLMKLKEEKRKGYINGTVLH